MSLLEKSWTPNIWLEEEEEEAAVHIAGDRTEEDCVA